ncbi:MAG: hypothetical protein K8U57_38555 [Planctomycetes bacterium]|nr:hypothetical protein [Planctomycetota bacterium]
MTDYFECACIPLSRGQHALVDAADFEMIAAFRWHCHVSGGGEMYARKYPRDGVSQMHRLILGETRGVDIDHINGNGLDNRRINLRFCNDQRSQSRNRNALTSRKWASELVNE